MILNKDWLGNEKDEILGEVLTTKEIESEYGLPLNRVLQDIRRGIIRDNQCRQSGKVWLVTRTECNRMYANYVPRKANKEED